ncbi:MAG TPA: hypothetical protein VM431_02470, partial [Phycisphaerae bacterium]|nr:hypothetical protein [Phycisphaerae bacterium]
MKTAARVASMVVLAVLAATLPAAAGVGYLDEGTLVAWGRNDRGQCNVPAGFYTQAAGGYYHSLALRPDGSVAAWGWNGYGQCTVPAGLAGVTQVAGGWEHSLALKGDGSVVAWGYNDYGQCTVPGGLAGVTQVAGGYYHSLALKADGSVAAWGDNNYGQCTVPAGLAGVTQVAGGYGYSLALTTDGSVAAWGDNSGGQCDVPAGLADVIQVAAGRMHSVALKADGSVAAWGRNDHGQCNVPTEGCFVAVAAGYYHSLGLKARLTYEDLLVTGTGARALLQRSITVSGDATIETAMTMINQPTMTVGGQVRVVSGGTLDLDDGTVSCRTLDLDEGTVSCQTLDISPNAGDPMLVDVGAGGLLDVGARLRIYPDSTLTNAGKIRIGSGVTPKAGNLLVDGGGVLEMTGGTASTANALILGEGGSVSGHGTVEAEFSCSHADAALTADGGVLTVGKADSYAGFAMPNGAIAVHPGATLELLTKGFARLGTLTTLDGGTLSAGNGVALETGRNLCGSGAVNAKVAAGFGSTIEATGALTMGDADAYDGFFSDGSLLTGAHTVTLYDRNVAVLGSLTELGDGASGGVLTAGAADPADAFAHFLLEQGKNMVGRGQVNGHTKNHGDVIGDGTGLDERIVFNAPWIVTGKGTFENTLILGTFA